MFLKLASSYCLNLASRRSFSRSDKSAAGFLKNVGENVPSDKVSVIGVGQVGAACAAFILKKNLTKHLVLLDVRDDWAKAEGLEFLHASSLMGSPTVEAGADVALTANSKYIVITAGARPVNESRLQVAQKTADMLIKMVQELTKVSPDATFIICANPPDVVTWAIQQITKLPKDRCISAGCNLDSMRFRYYIAKRLGVAASNVTAFIIGEHGDSSVPVWSGVNVGGISLIRVMPDIGTPKDKENWQEIHQNVVTSAKQVSDTKGYTSWAVGLSVGEIIYAMQRDSGCILSVGTDVKGIMGIEDNIVLSLPSVLGKRGIRQVLELPLTKFEMEMFHKSAETLLKSQCSLRLS